MSATTGNVLAGRIAERGWVVVDLGERALARMVQPWLLIDGLLGTAPQLTEVQPIRPVAQARSFAASTGPAPLHTDSQQWRARPADLQLTACLRPSASGGDSTLVDGFALADQLSRDDAPLFAAMLQRPRCMPFVFGNVFGPTLARRDDRYAFTHTPRPVDGDPIASALEAALARAPVERVRLERGQALLVDNHRMLHGRDAFDDPQRELLRVLAWLEHPLGGRPRWAEMADAVHAGLAGALQGRSIAVQRAFGIEPTTLAPLDAAVSAMLAGAPPGALARRLGVDEAVLYRRRDALAVVASPIEGADACMRALAELDRSR
jgi:hypothetical protein